MSHSFDFYFNYGYPPMPDQLYYRHYFRSALNNCNCLIESYFRLPTNTFEELMAIRQCDSESDCEKKNEEDKDLLRGHKHGHPFGVHFPTEGELDLCFHKFDTKCRVMLALRLIDIDTEAKSDVEIETVNVGCRTLIQGTKSWSRDECEVSKKTSSETTVCVCTPRQSAFTFSTDVAVPPRSLNFDSIKSANINAASVIIAAFSAGLITVYLFALFYAQRNDRLRFCTNTIYMRKFVRSLLTFSAY